jgi:hypothetical protein
MRSLSLFLVLFLVACAGSGGEEPTQQQAGGGQGSGSGGGGAGGGGNPAPPAPPRITFDDAVFDLGVSGGFPSDMVFVNDRLYTVDDAAVPANVVVFDQGVPTSIAITANQLIDHDGLTPARAPATAGNGLFGAFLGDLEIALNRYVLVTVGAGNSVSDDGANPLRLANLVVLDGQTGTYVQTVNLAGELAVAGEFSNSGNYVSIPQSLPVMSAFVPDRTDPQKGTIYVAMSNGAGSSAGLSTFFAGTVQEWSVDFARNDPVASAPDRTYVTAHYHPVGLSFYATRDNRPYVILTSAGASQFDASFVLQPTTDAYLEFLDLDAALWRDTWAVNLGRIVPSTHALAIGAEFALLTSQTFAQVYAVDLSGLESQPVDTAKLRLFQTVDLVPGGAVAGSGFQSDVVIRPSGKHAVVSSFTRASLTVLELPGDIATGTILVNPPPFDAASMQSTLGLGLGAVINGDDLFFVVNGNFNPARNSFVGSLDADGALD